MSVSYSTSTNFSMTIDFLIISYNDKVLIHHLISKISLHLVSNLLSIFAMVYGIIPLHFLQIQKQMFIFQDRLSIDLMKIILAESIFIILICQYILFSVIVLFEGVGIPMNQTNSSKTNFF